MEMHEQTLSEIERDCGLASRPVEVKSGLIAGTFVAVGNNHDLIAMFEHQKDAEFYANAFDRLNESAREIRRLAAAVMQARTETAMLATSKRTVRYIGPRWIQRWLDQGHRIKKRLSRGIRWYWPQIKNGHFRCVFALLIRKAHLILNWIEAR